MRRWSKLKKKIEELFSKDLNLQIHCNVYSVATKHCTYHSPRHWLVLDKEIIFDFPGQFLEWKNPDSKSAIQYLDSEGSTIGMLIDQYLEIPRDKLLDKVFSDDRWKFTDILKVADRRLGKARLLEKYAASSPNTAVSKVLRKRVGVSKLFT